MKEKILAQLSEKMECNHKFPRCGPILTINISKSGVWQQCQAMFVFNAVLNQ